MAGTKLLRAKFKSFFQSKGGSDEGLEIVQKFLLPFVRELPQWSIGIDDVLKAFFALDTREFFYVRAKRKFRLPGNFLAAGDHIIPGLRPWIKKGQVLLLALDRVDGNARVGFFENKQEMNYRLFRYEVEAIKDNLEVLGEGDRDRYRDYGTQPVAGPNNRDRKLRRTRLRKSSNR